MELIIKLLTYSIIMTIVGVIVSKVNSDSKDIKITQDGEFYWDQKLVSKILLICGVIFSIIFIFVSSFPSNIEGSTKTIVMICVIIINLLLYFGAYIYHVTFIKITKDRIIYDLGLSKKELLYTEITNAKRNSFSDIVLYKNNKKVLTIPKDFAVAEAMLEYHGIIEKENKDEFIMQVSTFYKGLMISCCIVFIVLLILCVCVNNRVGILLFGIMLIISFIECVNEFRLKVIVSKKEIRKITLFKNKSILIQNISKVEKKTIDNAEWYYLYSKDGLEMKINMLYTNSYLLEELLKKKI